jgi:CRISPR-associated endoribonuclease Cas6
MQFRLKFSFNGSLTLPISHHYVIQGFIYNILKDAPEFSAFLHDQGYQNDKQIFKMFVFSRLMGKYTVEMPDITFHNEISLEIRSPLDQLCNVLFMALMHQESFFINRKQVFLTSCDVSNTRINADELNISMLSPICLYTTYYEEDSKKTRYFSPLDEEFEAMINENLYHKLESIYDFDGCPKVAIETISCTGRDKYVTTFKGTKITAWNGRFILRGEPFLLQFLYNTGLGAKNSQGFGMFKLLNP